MNEITLDIEPSVLAVWKQDPVTVKVFDFWRKIQQANIMAFSSIPTQSYSSEKIALEVTRLQGIIQGYEEILTVRSDFDEEI